MTLQQCEYIVAVDIHRHFAKAASACHVTQPTLSMMIQKLEEEMEVIIFDRSKHPVIPTDIGKKIIEKARDMIIIRQEIKEIVQEDQGLLNGQLNIGILPTIAPYLLPLFLNPFLKAHPKIRLKISENTTEVILEKLKKGTLDAGLLVTPVKESNINEIPLFYEPFVVFSSHSYPKEYLLPEDIDPHELWLLEEGHCFRSQIINLCELQKKLDMPIEYESGSLETLKHLVESNQGVTILPELATWQLTEKQKEHILQFQAPVPVREVSLVTHRNFYKRRFINALKLEIQKVVPAQMKEFEPWRRIPI